MHPEQTPITKEISARLRLVIKQIMKAKDLTQSDLAAAMGVSQATVKRMLNSEDLSVSRLQQVADILDVSFFELMRLADDVRVTGALMTEDQEQFLATHRGHAHLLWRLVSGYSVERVARDNGVTAQDLQGYVDDLVDFTLVARIGKRIKPLVSWPVGVRFKGPLYDVLGRSSFDAFLDRLWRKVEHFDPETSTDRDFGLRMSQLLLRKSQYQEFLKEMGQLMLRYLSKSRMERATAADGELETVTLLMGIDLHDAICEHFGPIAPYPRR